MGVVASRGPWWCCGSRERRRKGEEERKQLNRDLLQGPVVPNLLCAGKIFHFSSIFIRRGADVTQYPPADESNQRLLTRSFPICHFDKWCFATLCVTFDMQTLKMANTVNVFPQRPCWMWKCSLHVGISLVTIFPTLVCCIVPPLCAPSCHFLFSAWNRTSPCAALEDN